MIHYEVLLTEGAERDLEAIYDYIAEFDSAANADSVLYQLLEVTETLATFPERGSHPKEFSRLVFASTARPSSSPTE